MRAEWATSHRTRRREAAGTRCGSTWATARVNTHWFRAISSGRAISATASFATEASDRYPGPARDRTQPADGYRGTLGRAGVGRRLNVRAAGAAGTRGRGAGTPDPGSPAAG